LAFGDDQLQVPGRISNIVLTHCSGDDPDSVMRIECAISESAARHDDLACRQDRTGARSSRHVSTLARLSSLPLCRRTGREIVTAASVLRRPEAEVAADAGADTDTAAGS
jgi:hypothetical protein